MKYPFIPTPTDSKDAREEMQNTASTLLTLETAQYHVLVKERKANAITLSIVKPERGKEAVRVHQSNNGDIHHYRDGIETPSDLYLPGELEQNIHEWATRRLTDLITKHTGRDNMINMLADPNYSDLAKEISSQAASTINQALQPFQRDSPGNWITSIQIALSEANEIIHNEMIDHRILHLAGTVLSPHSSRHSLTLSPPSKTYNAISTHTYNLFRLNRDTFNILIQNGYQHPLRLYTTIINPPKRRNERIHHPGRVINALRKALALTPAQWRIFLKIDSNHYIHQNDPITYIQSRSKLIADLNRPDLNDDENTELFNYPNLMEFQNQPWGHGDANEAWKQVLRSYIAHTIPQNKENREQPEQQQGYEDRFQPHQNIPYVADALRGTINMDLPWGPGKWNDLMRRTQRWHNQYGNQPNNMPLNLRNTTWESALTDDQLKHIAEIAMEDTAGEIEHLGSGKSLQFAASMMNNCLSNYVQRCYEGRSRIFLITADEDIIAATQIIRDDKDWIQGQIEAPNREPLSPLALKTSKMIIEQYNLEELHQTTPES